MYVTKNSSDVFISKITSPEKIHVAQKILRFNTIYYTHALGAAEPSDSILA